MTRMATSAAMLPVYTLDVVRRYWAPLLCVYLVGKVVHDLMLRGMVWLSGFHYLLGLAGLGLATMVLLVTYIVMFHVLRSGLPTLEAEAGSGSGTTITITQRERRLVDAIAAAILPFLVFYEAWQKTGEELKDYSIQLLNEHGLDAYAKISEIDAVGAPLVVALALFAVARGLEWVYRRSNHTSKVLGLLAATAEATWMFFGVFTVSQLIDNVRGWAADRVVWVETQRQLVEISQRLTDLTSLPVDRGYAALLDWIPVVVAHLLDGLVQPLLWLTIAAVVFGADRARQESPLDHQAPLFRRGTRTERAERVVTTRRGLVGLLNRSYREKYIPPLNALRLILRASPLFYLSFCLYYVLLELGFSWLQRGVYVLVGPDDFVGWWSQWLVSLDIAADALHQVLRICLLAVTFEVTLRRLGTGGKGRRIHHTHRVVSYGH